MAFSDSSLSYRRIRAPKDHGQVIQLPEPSAWNELWRSNCMRDISRDAFVMQLPPDFFRESRVEILQAAIHYTQQYRDVNFTGRDRQRIIMAGHQPTLFHAGVWYKNFVLAHLAQRFNCYAINLIVDNDVCNSAAINVPARHEDTGKLFTVNLKYDSAAPAVPFESRSIQNREQFDRFGSTAATAIGPFVKNPLVRRLWPSVVAYSNDLNLGQAIAKGRHRLEGEIGIQTLEVPVSALSMTKAFAAVAQEILVRIPEFCRTYNEVADRYRNLHKIKNVAQPVPNLKTDSKWFETPFWIWRPNDPVRRSLYAKLNTDSLVISNRSGFERTVSNSASLDDFKTLITDDVCIRPKALITTMFCRLLGCDLFIHGIGGAKYDQLTDELCLQFFKTRLPEYLTVSGTFLIQQEVPRIELRQINGLKHRVREHRYHPEVYVKEKGPESDQWITAKDHWVQQKLPDGHRLQRHQEIEKSNRSLQKFVSDDIDYLHQEIERLESGIADARILNSREYSFCLHDESLLSSFSGLK